ncbi:MAG: nucleoside triphosphate pyrophosphohydrolase [Pseudomonadota bacterium]
MDQGRSPEGNTNSPGDLTTAGPETLPKREVTTLLAIMKALRTPETGCPWDLQQDFSSIAPYTLEEAYEVLDAIERGNMDDLRDELGDLLLQVVYHAQMATETEHFEFADVVEAITTKMVRRHPHVFGDAAARAAGVKAGFWERAKDAERQGTEKQRERVLDDIPATLPALTRALKLQTRAARVGFDWPDVTRVLDKVVEEAQELTEARARLSTDKQAEEFGDLLFVMVNLGRHLGLDAEDALRKANSKFTRRFNYVEDELKARGSSVQQAGLDEMDAIWNEIRRQDNSTE